MTKLVLLLAVSFLMSCASKKTTTTTTETAKGSSTATTATAPTAASTETKKEDTKKTKATAAKKVTDAKVAAEVTCTFKQETRKLAIKAKEQGCELEYTKGGTPSSVASQVVGQAKCEEVSTRIQEKLIAAGYACE